ncbi:hypothetical protein CF651_06515 [Paenibacillus rigui]|uniref:Uncharacterized protein n=1 Tax=Paenibacillus rigui TaxID=554312 RepID=A0A229UVX7_9BACL|nr:hypothetical protein CF651_06515 [Paenibacillus rigui]
MDGSFFRSLLSPDFIHFNPLIVVKIRGQRRTLMLLQNDSVHSASFSPASISTVYIVPIEVCYPNK